MFTRLLFDVAERQPEQAFLHFEDRVFTYGEFARLVSALTSDLWARGVRPGNHIALICGNRPAYLIAWFALSEIGAVTVPLNTALVGDGLRYTLCQSEASLLLIDESLLAEKAPHIEGLNLPVLEIGDLIENGVGADPAPGRARREPSTVNAILYTSGTTGLPKGAMISEGCYLAAGEDMAAALALTQDDRILVVLPLFHANPQMYAVMSVLRVGASLILAPRFSASEFFAYARRHQATGFTYVGTILNILEKTYPEPQRDHALKWCVGGGAPAAIWNAVAERFGLQVLELYGMTETGGWVTMNTPHDAQVGTVGRPRRGVCVEILDETDALLAPGQKGEIVAASDRPDLFFSGYYNNPQATSATLRDGRLYTGDSGHLQEDGYLVFEGRIKELIRRGGEMISPVEIELQIMQHPGVRDCGVVGVPDDVLGEEIKAVVVAEEGFEPLALRAFLKDRLPSYMAPRYVALVPAIPKTETAKVKRHELRTIVNGIVDLAPRSRPRPTVAGAAQ